MIELAEVVYHWQKGQNITQISNSLHISRPTVRKYLRIAEEAGLTKDADSTATAIALDAINNSLNPSSSTEGAAQQAIAAYEENIKSWLSEPDMTAKQICRLLNELGNSFSYTSVKRYVRRLTPDMSRPVTIRIETPAGEQAQVDFGQVTLTLGEIRKRVWAFIMTLAFSRHRFVRFVQRQDTATWLDCHIRAFEFFGGVPRTVLLDNLKAGVVKPDLYDPTINRAYGELERHYGFVADPAKVGTPEHKEYVSYCTSCGR